MAVVEFARDYWVWRPGPPKTRKRSLLSLEMMDGKKDYNKGAPCVPGAYACNVKRLEGKPYLCDTLMQDVTAIAMKATQYLDQLKKLNEGRRSNPESGLVNDRIKRSPLVCGGQFSSLTKKYRS